VRELMVGDRVTCDLKCCVCLSCDSQSLGDIFSVSSADHHQYLEDPCQQPHASASPSQMNFALNQELSIASRRLRQHPK
jgi:hypothetical protein